MLGTQPDRGVAGRGLTSAFASGLVSGHERDGDQTQPGPGRLLARRRLAPCPREAAVGRHCARQPLWRREGKSES